MLVVEAVEVVGDADRIDRNRLRPASLRRFRGDAGKLEQALDQLPLLGLQRLTRDQRAAWLPRPVTEDPGNPGGRGLDVVAGGLLTPPGAQVGADLDRLVGRP